MTYEKTAKKTAEKNGMVCAMPMHGEKAVVDFTAVKDYLRDQNEFSAEEVYAAMEAAVVSSLESAEVIINSYSAIKFYVNNLEFYVDFISAREQVYAGGRRKYFVLKPVAMRLNIYTDGANVFCGEMDWTRYATAFMPIMDVEI